MRLTEQGRLLALTLLGAGSLLAGACGSSGGTLPEPPPCATPTAAATPGQGSYFNLVRRANDTLVARLTAFRAQYPGGKFFRSGSFREDFVVYYGAATCALDDLANAVLPGNANAAGRERDAQIKAIAVGYRAVMDYGLNAVKQRNTSDYRKWNTRVDAVASRLATALALPTR